jgi:transposase
MSADARPSTIATAPEPEAALPDDPVILKQMVRELLAELRKARSENAALEHRLDLLLRRLYGPRTERIDPAQLLLISDALEPAEASPIPPAPVPAEPFLELTAARKPRHPHGRRKLPAHLERRTTFHRLTEAERVCPECGTTRTEIGEQRSEQLDYKPSALFIAEHVRLTYACPCCEAQVVTAAKPAQPIDKGLPGPGLLAYIVTTKYCDHIPLYRLERILRRLGADISRSTMCDWMAAAAKRLEPLYDLMKALVVCSAVIHTDDTAVNVRDAKRKVKLTGRLWGYFGDTEHPLNVFDFSPNRRRDGPMEFLEEFRGHLQADAYSGYDGVYAGGHVTEVGCNAHARRKFVDAQTTDPALTAMAFGYYRELYAIEKDITAEIAKLSKDADESVRAAIRLRVRQERAAPVVANFRIWLEARKAEVLPKSPIAGAIGYVLNQWAALTRYVDSGKLSIDNNISEREMKTIAIGRNYAGLGIMRSPARHTAPRPLVSASTGTTARWLGSA